MNIDSKEIQKIIDESNLKDSNWLRDRMKKLIDPKPVLVVGEIAIFYDEGSSRVGLFAGVTPQGLYWNDGDQAFEACEKLDTIPIALIPHYSNERPEGLKDDDLIMYHRKGWNANHTVNRFFENITSWVNIDGYKKINFLGGDE